MSKTTYESLDEVATGRDHWRTVLTQIGMRDVVADELRQEDALRDHADEIADYAIDHIVERTAQELSPGGALHGIDWLAGGPVGGGDLARRIGEEAVQRAIEAILSKYYPEEPA